VPSITYGLFLSASQSISGVDGKEIADANVYGEETQTGWVRRADVATRNYHFVF
jgi:hypothetical protein